MVGVALVFFINEFKMQLEGKDQLKFRFFSPDVSWFHWILILGAVDFNFQASHGYFWKGKERNLNSLTVLLLNRIECLTFQLSVAVFFLVHSYCFCNQNEHLGVLPVFPLFLDWLKVAWFSLFCCSSQFFVVSWMSNTRQWEWNNSTTVRKKRPINCRREGCEWTELFASS